MGKSKNKKSDHKNNEEQKRQSKKISSKRMKKKEEDSYEQEQKPKKKIKKYTSQSQIQEQEQDQQQEQEDYKKKEIKEFLDDQAQQDSNQQQSQLDSQAQLDRKQQNQHFANLYKVKEKRPTQKLLQQLQGMQQQDQINNLYKQKMHDKNRANQFEEQEQLQTIDYTQSYRLPTDYPLFQIACRYGEQQTIIFNILKRAKIVFQDPNSKYYCNIACAYADKKLHKGKIYVEAPNQKQIIRSFDGFRDVFLKRIKRVHLQKQNLLFNRNAAKKSLYNISQYVRINVGTYEGDIGQIVKLNKNGAVIQVVPRINIVQISSKIKAIDAQSKNDDVWAQLQKNNIIKQLTNPKRKFKFKSQRPQKKFINQSQFQQFKQMAALRKITFTNDGFLLITLDNSEFGLPQHEITKLQLNPFNVNHQNQQQFFQKQKQKIKYDLNLRFDTKIQIVAGQLKGIIGTVLSCDQTSVTLKVLNTQIKGFEIMQMISHVQRYYEVGEEVQIVNGPNIGGIGRIIKKNDDLTVSLITLDKQMLTISIRQLEYPDIVSKKRQLNHPYENQDIIKYNKGSIAYVLAVNGNYLQIITTNSQHKYIKVFNVDNKIGKLFDNYLNNQGQKIQRNCRVKVKQGRHSSSFCQVKRVFNNHVFLKSHNFQINNGIFAENINNIQLIMSTSREDILRQKKLQRQMNKSDGQYKIGERMKVPLGDLKGYQGIIKRISPKDIVLLIYSKNIQISLNRFQLDRYRNSIGKSHMDQSRCSQYGRD